MNPYEGAVGSTEIEVISLQLLYKGRVLVHLNMIQRIFFWTIWFPHSTSTNWLCAQNFHEGASHSFRQNLTHLRSVTHLMNIFSKFEFFKEAWSSCRRSQCLPNSVFTTLWKLWNGAKGTGIVTEHKWDQQRVIHNSGDCSNLFWQKQSKEHCFKKNCQLNSIYFLLMQLLSLITYMH